MAISKEALKGYLLEEALAYLIKGTGYRLLVDESQDLQELRNRPNGLVAIGRGGEHQADVLGELAWIPVFTYPIRLFVEAKCRKNKTGIGPIRSAVGIVEDLNQNFISMNNELMERKILFKRYNYNYALFSASGFSENAILMALAHKISLIDLSGSEFLPLIRCIDITASDLIELLINNEEVAVSREGSIRKMDSNKFTLTIRRFIRTRLDTWPTNIETYNHADFQFDNNLQRFLEELLSYFFNVVRNYGELFVAMANGPFLLMLKADDPEQFITYAKEYPSHDVHITWNLEDNQGRKWYIKPKYNENAYCLSFKLPKLLGDWIFSSHNSIQRALDVKTQFLSNITIYRSSTEKDELFRLRYDPLSIS